MGSSNEKTQIEFFVCSAGAINEDLLTKLFPTRINNTTRKLNDYDMNYIAKLYSGNNHLEALIRDIKDNNNNGKRNNIIICFCDDNNNFDNHTRYWIELINKIAADIREVNYPLVIILNPYENNFDFDQSFSRHRDRRTITILKIENNNSPENIEHNYRLILSLFWEKNLYLNQKEIKPNKKNVNANFFRINSIEPTSSINIFQMFMIILIILFIILLFFVSIETICKCIVTICFSICFWKNCDCEGYKSFFGSICEKEEKINDSNDPNELIGLNNIINIEMPPNTSENQSLNKMKL